MSDLIELQRNHLLSLIDEIKTEHNVKFLIIDAEVEKLLSYLFLTPQELLRYVTAVDRIDSPKRKGQPSVEAIYLLSPTRFNINCIDVDFCNRPPKYKKCHIRFLPEPAPHIPEFFKTKRYIVQYLASVKEIPLSFIPKESQLFLTMGIDKPIQCFFNKQCAELITKNMKRTINSLLNLCIITGEYPIIRYSEPAANQVELAPATVLAKKLAFEFQEVLDNYAREHEDFPPPSPRPRAIFLITDRSLDLFSPIIHDFNYQAMAYDLVSTLDTGTDTFHYTAENEKGEEEEKTTKLLDNADPDWIELKHQHIMDANTYLEGKIKEMIAKNPLLVDRSNVKTTTDLLSVVAHLKDFDEDRRRLILHRKLIDQCFSVNNERKIAEYAEIEQNLAGFGLDIDGEKFKHITDHLLVVLSSKHPSVTDKVRYIIIYSLYRGGIIEADYVKLLSFIGIEAEHEHFGHFMLLFKNFNELGYKLIKEHPRDKPFKKQWFHDTIVKDPNVYVTSRFVSTAGNLLAKFIENPLLVSEECFPYTKDKPIELVEGDESEPVMGVSSSTSLRNPRHKAVWTKNTTNARKIPRQRFFYYVIGGISYSEVRAAYEQSELKNKDVFIGSDGIITPLAFMKSIETLTAPRDQLDLKDDQRVSDKVPQYLYESVAPIAGPVNHVHIKSQNAPPISNSVPKTDAKEPVKEKKRSKFSRFLKSRDK